MRTTHAPHFPFVKYGQKTVTLFACFVVVVFFHLCNSVIAKPLFLFLKHPFLNTYQEMATIKARTRAGALIMWLASSLQLLNLQELWLF